MNRKELLEAINTIENMAMCKQFLKKLVNDVSLRRRKKND